MSVDAVGAHAPSVELAWLAFEVADVDLWRRYLGDILGVHTEDLPGGAPGFVGRVDDRARRFLFTEGPRDDLVDVAWCFPDDDALVDALARAEALGAETQEAHPDYAAANGVTRMVRLRDPARIPVSLVTGQARSGEPLHLLPGHKGFVAGDLGLGHVVLRTLDKAESRAFYEALLGLRHSDDIVTEIAGHAVDLSFLHAPSGPEAPARHHSLAVGGPLPKRLHHFMLECRSIDDVGACYDRMVRLYLPIFQTLGRHPNDRMLSFYAITPAGFQVELGWGGRLVDDEVWESGHYDQISEWGHHHPTRFKPRMPRLEGWPVPPSGDAP